MKNFKAAFNDYSDKATRTMENPISGKILVVATGHGIIHDTAKTAARYLVPEYSDRVLSVAVDYGHTFVDLQSTPDMTAVDIYQQLMKKRSGQDVQAGVLKVKKVEGGTVHAAFLDEAANWPEQLTEIYNTAIDAAVLSRQNGNKPVEFEFRGQKVVVDGKTRPEDVEKKFPGNQRLRF